MKTCGQCAFFVKNLCTADDFFDEPCDSNSTAEDCEVFSYREQELDSMTENETEIEQLKHQIVQYQKDLLELYTDLMLRITELDEKDAEIAELKQKLSNND